MSEWADSGPFAHRPGGQTLGGSTSMRSFEPGGRAVASRRSRGHPVGRTHDVPIDAAADVEPAWRARPRTRPRRRRDTRASAPNGGSDSSRRRARSPSATIGRVGGHGGMEHLVIGHERLHQQPSRRAIAARRAGRATSSAIACSAARIARGEQLGVEVEERDDVGIAARGAARPRCRRRRRRGRAARRTSPVTATTGRFGAPPPAPRAVG